MSYQNQIRIRADKREEMNKETQANRGNTKKETGETEKGREERMIERSSG